MGSSKTRCGTPSGWSRHMQAGEQPCAPCKAAKAEADKRWRESGDRTKINRATAKAQHRANRDLARAHHAEYRALYAAHKAEIFRELGLS